MKSIRAFTVLAATLLALVSCQKEKNQTPYHVTSPFTITSPTPKEQITKVSLNETQQGYVQAGNAMAFRFLKQLYNGNDLICSPLSLQYALAMTANGAQGETLQEIIDFLGYGDEGIQALNEYSRCLLEQLPAVDLDVTLKVTDALLVNDEFPLLPAFRKTVEDYYYAAVDNMDFSSREAVADRINEWASRNTNGFIDKVLEKEEVAEDAAAFLMNALYFKAKWAGDEYNPMFQEEGTREDSFTLSDGSSRKIDMMNTAAYLPYAEMDGFKVVALPYADWKYFMYILLPDGNDLEGLLNQMQTLSWAEIGKHFRQDAEVHVKLPKFEIENKFDLKETLKALGINRAFKPFEAQFDGMFAPKEEDYYFWIEKVIQKSRISVAEWGTEAAAVTVVEMCYETEAGELPKQVFFNADHPFLFAIGESTSGTLLFAGTFTGAE